MDADLQAEVQMLRSMLSRISSRLDELQNPQGRMFIADLTNAGSSNRNMLELIPNAAGNTLQTLINGRSVSGATDSGVFLAIPGLKSGEGLMMGYDNGTNRVYVRCSDQLRYGVIQAVGVCNSYCTVKESDEFGTILSNLIVTVFPTFGGCVNTANGFCLTAGDIIAYMASPGNPTSGVQVGAYKSVALGYKCTSGTSFTNVPGLSAITLYNSDFFISADSDCGDSDFTNRANLYWRGFIVKGAYDDSICGATNTSSLGGVKVLDYTTGISGASYDTNKARIQFDIICDDTTDNVPTIGGTPCNDESGPKVAKIKGYYPVGTTIDASDPAAITIVCNEDGTITLNYPTMKCLVPWP